ncbi:caa(3)-type oxidase subunit IV [Agrobacterium rhizogenes]|nr:caa(3)-type oxidase subunit IV [Rhizobium rhizogenes]NTH62162.1 caa(3)-type oxidase subunit IV [Rhizobium rhizogenes]NTH93788.1 caa(3)-type oxidase subunit IV [Rhizobium rhizogenes]
MLRLPNPLALIWIVLLLLLAATIGNSFLLGGAIGPMVSLSIAMAKSALIYWGYMHLNEETALGRTAALAGAAWLLILLPFLCVDYLTRSLA